MIAIDSLNFSSENLLLHNRNRGWKCQPQAFNFAHPFAFKPMWLPMKMFTFMAV